MPTATQDLPQVKRLQRDKALLSQMDSVFAPYRSVYDDIAANILPHRGAMDPHNTDQGRRNEGIINSTPVLASRTLTSGLVAGVTNPARPWKRRKAPKPELEEISSVAMFLKALDDWYFRTYERSNFYLEIPTHYDDVGGFATAVTLVEPTGDPSTIARYTGLRPGSYRLGWDRDGNPNTLAYRTRITADQIMRDYCKPNPKEKFGYDLSKLSSAVQIAIATGDSQTKFTVVILIRPNEEFDPKKPQAKYKRFISLHFEESQVDTEVEGKYLRESGFNRFPALVSVWKRPHNESYGSDSPGWVALGDAERLQMLEEDDYRALQYGIEPPLDVPSSYRGGQVKRQPGGVNVREQGGGADEKVSSLWEVKLDRAGMGEKIAKVESLIQAAFFTNFILALQRLRAQNAQGAITATEVQALKDEGLAEFGPVMQSFQRMLKHNDDLLFDFGWELGVIPGPIPEELAGLELRDEFTGTFALAMRLAAAQGNDRYLMDIATMSKFAPEALDNVDVDGVSNVKAEIYSVDPRIRRFKEEIAAIRQARARAVQQQQQAETLATAASAGKDLAATPVGGGNALEALAALSNAGPGPETP